MIDIHIPQKGGVDLMWYALNGVWSVHQGFLVCLPSAVCFFWGGAHLYGRVQEPYYVSVVQLVVNSGRLTTSFPMSYQYFFLLRCFTFF